MRVRIRVRRTASAGVINSQMPSDATMRHASFSSSLKLLTWMYVRKGASIDPRVREHRASVMCVRARVNVFTRARSRRPRGAPTRRVRQGGGYRSRLTSGSATITPGVAMIAFVVYVTCVTSGSTIAHRAVVTNVACVTSGSAITPCSLIAWSPIARLFATPSPGSACGDREGAADGELKLDGATAGPAKVQRGTCHRLERGARHRRRGFDAAAV